MIVRKFIPDDIKSINIQSNQRHITSYLSGVDFSHLQGYTALEGDTVLFCGGLQLIYGNRYIAWSVFSEHSGRNMLGIIRGIKKVINQYTGRIECTCDVNFSAAHRLVKLLGFTCEAPLMKQYELDGRDSSLYSLVRN